MTARYWIMWTCPQCKHDHKWRWWDYDTFDGPITMHCDDCKVESKLYLQQTDSNQWEAKPMALVQSVLQLFLQFPDRELRSRDVHQWLVNNGRPLKWEKDVSKACALLHREGRLFRVQDGKWAWYCIAREAK